MRVGFAQEPDGLMRVWSHRPPSLLFGLFFVAYVLGCGFAEALRIVPGISVSIWPPGGVFIATLVLTSPYSWPWWMLAGCLAEMFAQALWFHSPLLAGLLIYAGNALCAVVGATLLNRISGRPVRLETLREVIAFVVLGAGVAPLASATVGSATLAWFGVQSQAFTAVWPLFWIGDATGILLVGPLALVVIQHWRSTSRLSVTQWFEAGILGLVFLGVAALSLSSHYLPFAYIIMPPLLWAAVRFEFKGVAVALTLLALLTMALTLSGASQFVGDPQSQREKQIMLQLFLVISAFSALIVAAISRQHQQALVALRGRERELQQLIDTVPAHIWCATAKGIPCYLNKKATEVTGVALKDLIADDGSRSLTLIHPEDLEATDRALARSFETGAPFVRRFRLRQANGPHRWVESRAEPLRDDAGNIVQWYGVSVDIHDLVTAQEALRNQETELSQLVNMVPVYIRRLTPEGEPTFFNKRLTDFFGLDVADLDKPDKGRMETSIDMLTHPDDAGNLLETARRSFATGEPFSMKYRMRRADGVYRWVDSRAEPLRSQSGEIVQWYIVSLDIHEEMRTQQALRDREWELSQLVTMVPSLLWRLNPDGEPNFFNKRTIDFLGLDTADYDKPGMSRLAATLAAIIHPDDAAGVSEAFDHSFATGEHFSMRYRLRRADGVYRWVLGRAEPMRDESGHIVQWYGLAHDIDDQMRAEEALRRAQNKLARASQAASLSELSASIAHEVNQPLAAIVATSHACSRWLSADPPNLERAKNTLERIIRDANSASEVVSRIRALFNQLGKTRLPADMTEVIAGVGRLMADELALRKIQLEYEFAPSLPPALIDSVQMEQVLINLIRNAVDAMDTMIDGTRLIRLRAVVDSDSAIRIEVQDQGPGMMKEAELAFEPFFTTKKGGMGMGLAICRSIIESHNGRLWAVSNQPRGTTLAFTLPIQARSAA